MATGFVATFLKVQRHVAPGIQGNLNIAVILFDYLILILLFTLQVVLIQIFVMLVKEIELCQL